MACRLSDFDIVMYIGQDWHLFHYRSQMTRALAQNLEGRCKLLLVEQPICPIVTPLRHRAKLRDWAAGRRRLRKVTDNLFVCTPWVFLHPQLAEYVPFAWPGNHWLLSRVLRSKLRELGFSERIIGWVNHPLELDYLGLVGESVVVFDCFDEYSERYGLSSRLREEIYTKEQVLLAKADIVFTTASGLYYAKKTYNDCTYLIPNGVDYDHFAKTQAEGTPIAAEMRSLPRPIIGYLGTIHEHTDIGLMRHAAIRRPEWSFVLIGPQEQPSFSRSAVFRNFRALPNVHLLGWIEYEDIPSYAKAFDVCVIPYRLDRFNTYVYPNKVNEYLAMGKPVVATRLPELESFKDVVYLAQDEDDFVAGITEMLGRDSPQLVRERLSVAQANSWKSRTNRMIEILEHRIQELS